MAEHFEYPFTMESPNISVEPVGLQTFDADACAETSLSLDEVRYAMTSFVV